MDKPASATSFLDRLKARLGLAGGDASRAGGRSPLYLATLLGAFALGGAGLLASGHNATEGAIAERMKEDLLGSLALVIPASVHDNDPVRDQYTIAMADGTSRTIYPALSAGAVRAVAYEVTGQGYGGAIRILMGVAADGSLLGVRVLQHTETPGLGDKIEEAKGPWVLGFTGLSFGNPPKDKWGVKKDGGHFDQFSGATITPRAVVAAVREGLEFFDADRPTLTAPPGGEQK